MQPLRYSINITVDGHCGHELGIPDDELMVHYTSTMERADTLLFGRVIYGMMEEAWRKPADGVWPEWMSESEIPFAEAIDATPKRVVSNTLAEVDWNAQLVQGDLETAVRALKEEPGDGIYVGGVTLPLALANLGLIDEYELLVHPIVAGYGPTLFAGLDEALRLTLVERKEFSASGVVLLRYVPAEDAS